jgi:hypothetical protein
MISDQCVSLTLARSGGDRCGPFVFRKKGPGDGPPGPNSYDAEKPWELTRAATISDSMREAELAH